MIRIIMILLLTARIGFCQIPKLYIHLVSHNEPNENLQTPLNYSKAKTNLLRMAELVDRKNVKWNLQTSDGLVLGALSDQANSSTNIFKILSDASYTDNIEIDPRSKNSGGRNIADQWYLLDSLGANPTFHLGGCIYSTTNPSIQPIDWEQYRNPIIGNIYHNSWQCQLITGAGSYPPHTNDLNDFGIFKPDTANNFYSHNPSKNLWCIGTGCAPVLDSLDDEQLIFQLIKNQVDSIQSEKWPGDKFYVTRIMTNQREYGSLFFEKLSRLLDSLNTLPAAQLQWATIGETFEAFQEWQSQSGKDHSQWRCGRLRTSVGEYELNTPITIFPNPSHGIFTFQFADLSLHEIELFDLTGKIKLKENFLTNSKLDLSNFADGIYILRVDQKLNSKLIKQ
ncbi:MAG TPA: T9SS type A sorting domain-containing protein [Saprospiraceae bacterium]|nr:T9SS type A sorting domain-containing protein [Saprospiraceae bacterium]